MRSSRRWHRTFFRYERFADSLEFRKDLFGDLQFFAMKNTVKEAVRDLRVLKACLTLSQEFLKIL